MKLVRIYDYGGPEQLKYEEAERPSVGPTQLLVRVVAGSVNPMDWKLRSGAARAIAPLPMPVVLGGDLAGVVEAVGDQVTGWELGDAVFAMIGLIGAYAEYVAIEASMAARKPSNLTFEEAASLPLVALTAWQAFAEDGRDLNGLTTLIHNAAGGVGHVAVQSAKARGARVVATASSANAEFVRSLGADEIVDFRTTPVADHARDIDVMLDLVGNPEAVELWPLVKPGGSVIRIAGGADAAKLAEEGGIRVIKTRVRPNGKQLAEIGRLVEIGRIKTHIAATFPLQRIGEAQELSRTGRTRGKIVFVT